MTIWASLYWWAELIGNILLALFVIIGNIISFMIVRKEFRKESITLEDKIVLILLSLLTLFLSSLLLFDIYTYY